MSSKTTAEMLRADTNDELYYQTSSSGSSSSSSDSDSDDYESMNGINITNPELVVWIEIDDKRNESFGKQTNHMKPFQLRCGTGINTFKWLAMVASQRYAQLSRCNGTSRVRERYHCTPGYFSPALVNHKESESLRSSSPLLEGLRRRSMHRHGSAILRAVKTNALKINPKSSLREILCTGDTVVVVVASTGDAFCERDGRFVARSQPQVTPFEGAAFHTSQQGKPGTNNFVKKCNY